MRIVFAIDATGQSSEVADLLKLAIQSCCLKTSHLPIVLVDRLTLDFGQWLSDRRIQSHQVQTPLKPAITAAHVRSGYPLQAIGNYLRYEACRFIQDEVFLYCDADTIFLRDFSFPAEAPILFSAAPEDNLLDASRYNSGVLFVNRRALLAELPGFYDFASKNLERLFPGFDQQAGNEYFSGRFEKLPPEFNWRPYWGANDAAFILHTHGVKPTVASALLKGAYTADLSKQNQVEDLIVRSLENLPSFESGFTDDVGASLEGGVAWREIIRTVRQLKSNPILSSVSSAASAWNRAISAWERSERASFVERWGQRKLLVRGKTASARYVRLVIKSLSLNVCLSDVTFGDISTRKLNSSTSNNIFSIDHGSLPDGVIQVVRKVDPYLPLDFVFDLGSDVGNQVSLEIVQNSWLDVRVYWSLDGQFSEADSASLLSSPNDLAL